jgi:Secretion system C-terminal sorting domain
LIKQQLISINTGQTLTIANGTGTDLTVDGTLYNVGVITTTGTIAFNASSIYQHAQNGGTIPTASWNTTSTCYITGLTNTAPAGLTQSFGNFTYECPDHASLINFNSLLTSIAGDFTVKFAGEIQGNRTQNGLALSSNTSFTLNIGGDLIIDHPYNEATWLIMTTGTANVTLNVSGDFLMGNTGSGACFFDYKYGTGTAMGTLVINLTGNLTMTGGYLDMAYQGSSYTVATELRLYGNLSVSANSTLISSGANIVNGKVIFSKAGTQTIYEGGAGRIAYTNFQVNSGSTTEFLSNIYLYDYINALKSGSFTVLSGGIIDMNTYILHGYNIASGQINVVNTYTSITLSSGAGIITANTNGVHLNGFINASISAAIATRTFSSGANYTYDGVALQNSGTFTTTPVANQVNNLTINNTAPLSTGVTLQQEIKVANVCTFVSGVFTTTNTNILTINDNATIIGTDLDAGSNKYVNGPLKKIGNDAFAFPVGKQSHGCRPIFISAPLSTTDEFRAELIRGDAGLLGPITASGLQKVSGCEYWYLDRLAGTSSVDVSLSWSSESPCNAQSYVTDLPSLVAAHFNGTSWDAYGNDGGTAGNAVKGTVTWNNVSTFSPFSLGSLLWWTNPLTVKFINLQASEKNNQVKVEWANIAETGVDKYFVEHSTDGRSFTEITNSSARRNNGDKTDYSWWHLTPASGINYYRIKAIEYSGEITYSVIVRVTIGKTNNDFIVYPNPVKAGQVTISASALAAGKYDIVVLNMSGQKVMQTSLNHGGGSVSMQVKLPGSIKAGLYSMKLSGSEQQFIKTFLVE